MTNPLIFMFIVAPVHFWEESRPIQVPGWGSVEACQAAAPEFAKRYGAVNHRSKTYFLQPWKNEDVEEFVAAKVECVAIPNSLESNP